MSSLQTQIRLSLWINDNQSVREWFEKLGRSAKSTAISYASLLRKYWREGLAPRGYKTLDES